jgi:cell division protein FtsW (lipid II flippase)
MVVFLWLHLKISVDMYDNAEKQKKPIPYHRVVIISALLGFILALVAKFGPDKSSNIDAFIVWIVVFICFLIPSTFVYYLLKKRLENRDI